MSCMLWELWPTLLGIASNLPESQGCCIISSPVMRSDGEDISTFDMKLRHSAESMTSAGNL